MTTYQTLLMRMVYLGVAYGKGSQEIKHPHMGDVGEEGTDPAVFTAMG